MTAALEVGEWSAARSSHTLPLGKTQYPFYRRLGGSQGQSGWAENLIPTRIRSQIVQPVVSCYTDWATQPTLVCIYTRIVLMKDSHYLHNCHSWRRSCSILAEDIRLLNQHTWCAAQASVCHFDYCFICTEDWWSLTCAVRTSCFQTV